MAKYTGLFLTQILSLTFFACGFGASQSQLLGDANPDYFHECELTKAGLESISKQIATEVLVNSDYLAWGKLIKDSNSKESDIFIAPYAFQTRCYIDQPAEVTMDFIVLRTATDEKTGEVQQFFKKAKYYVATGKIDLVSAKLGKGDITVESKVEDLAGSKENAAIIYTKDRRVVSLGETYGRIYKKNFEASEPQAIEIESDSADEKVFLVFRSGLIKKHPLETPEDVKLTVSWDMKIVTINNADKKAFVNNIEVIEADIVKPDEVKTSEPTPEKAQETADVKETKSDI